MALRGKRRVAEEFERRLDEVVRRGAALLAGTLTVKGPGEDAVEPRPVALRELRHPMRDQRRLAHAAPGHEGDDSRSRIAKRNVEPADVFVAPDEPVGGVLEDAATSIRTSGSSVGDGEGMAGSRTARRAFSPKVPEGYSIYARRARPRGGK